MTVAIKMVLVFVIGMSSSLGGMAWHETGLLVPDETSPVSKVLPVSSRCFYDPRIYPCDGALSSALPDAGGSSGMPVSLRDGVPIAWAGVDNPNGNGIAYYEVQFRFGSDGEWQDWKTMTIRNADVFYPEDTGGVYFHEGTYYFRCRATDRSGNVEDYPQRADAAFEVTYWTPLENVEDAWHSWHDGYVQLPHNPDAPQSLDR